MKWYTKVIGQFMILTRVKLNQVDFERELDAGEDGVKPIKIVRRTLFPFMNPYPQKKVLTFNKHSEDFSFYVNYGNMSNLPDVEVVRLGSDNLTQVQTRLLKKIFFWQKFT